MKQHLLWIFLPQSAVTPVARAPSKDRQAYPIWTDRLRPLRVKSPGLDRTLLWKPAELRESDRSRLDFSARILSRRLPALHRCTDPLHAASEGWLSFLHSTGSIREPQLCR